MPYRFCQDESIAAGVGRIACEQIDRALADLRRHSARPAIAIHGLRRRCKKLRALLRLARPALGDVYTRENRRFRDLANRFSQARDAVIVAQRVDEMIAPGEAADKSNGFARIQHTLHQDRERLRPGADFDAQMRSASEALRKARGAIDTWPCDAVDEATICAGLKRTYGRARRAMACAGEHRTNENLHEWRKCVKYLGYHARLLADVSPTAMRAVAQALSELGHDLGLDHDLAVVHARLATINPPSSAAVRQTLRRRLAERRRDAQRSAFARGDWLFAEKPKAIAHQVSHAWRAR